MMKRIILLLTVIMTVLNAKAQQDVQLSQYIFNGIYINPAYTGYKEDLFVQSYFRSQWVGINGAPQSFAVAADGAFSSDHVGLGVTLSNDEIGAQSTLAGYLNYAYRIRTGNDETSHLSFGLAAGMIQLGIDGSKLNAVQPGDQSVPVASVSRIIPDANLGVYYANERWFTGFSATNVLSGLNHSNTENILIPIPQVSLYLTAGTLIPINDELRIKPVILLKDDLKGPTTLDVDGFMIFNERVTFGAFYRSSVKLYNKSNLQKNLPDENAFGAIAEFFASPGICISYSYDYALNSLGNYNYGSHELSIGFYINSRKSNSKISRCYKF